MLFCSLLSGRPLAFCHGSSFYHGYTVFGGCHDQLHNTYMDLTDSELKKGSIFKTGGCLSLKAKKKPADKGVNPLAKEPRVFKANPVSTEGGGVSGVSFRPVDDMWSGKNCTCIVLLCAIECLYHVNSNQKCMSCSSVIIQIFVICMLSAKYVFPPLVVSVVYLRSQFVIDLFDPCFGTVLCIWCDALVFCSRVGFWFSLSHCMTFAVMCIALGFRYFWHCCDLLLGLGQMLCVVGSCL